MDVTLALLCEAANSSAHDRLNLLGVFDTIAGATFPFQCPLMHVVLRMSVSEADLSRSHELSILMCNEEGEAVGTLTGDIVLPPSPSADRSSQLQLILELPNMPFPWPGRYQYHVLIDQAEKAVIPLSVVAVESERRQEVA